MTNETKKFAEHGKLIQGKSIVDVMGGMGVSVNKMDGWFNLATGLGIKGKDKRISGDVEWTPRTETEFESAFAQSDVIRRVVEAVPKEAIREWIEMRAEDQTQVDKMSDEHDRLEVKEKYFKAMVWCRLYGGGGIFMAVDDGEEDLSKPLNVANLREIKSLTVFNRFELHPISIDRNIESKNFGLPEIYLVSPRNGGQGGTHVHWTRIIRFDGLILPQIKFEENNYWGDSVITKMFEPTRDYNMAHASVAGVLQDFRVTVLQIKDLADILAADQEEKLKARIQLMNLTKSVFGSIAIDMDEKVENINPNVQGAKDLLDKVDGRLVTSTDLPHTIVLGEGSTGGLAGGGETEDKNFKKIVEADQETKLEKPLNLINDLIQVQKRGPFGGKEIKDFTWDFKALSHPTEKEKAETRKIQSETDKNYIDTMVLDPDEVAESRFGGEEFSFETSLDKETRQINETGRKEEMIKVDSLGPVEASGDHGHFSPLGGFLLKEIEPDKEEGHSHVDDRGRLWGVAIPLDDGGHFHKLEGNPKIKSFATLDMPDLMESIEFRKKEEL